MTDLVVGAGAVGTMLACALASSGRDVAIVRRRHEGLASASRIAVIDTAGRRREADVTVVARPSDLAVAPELIVFSVKMFDLADAVESCAVWPTAAALSVSNGIGAEETVGERRDAGLVAGSVTSAVEMRDDGTVVLLNRGGIGLAPVKGDVQPLIEALGHAFAIAGLRVVRADDAAAMKWSKLVGNLVGNATSAILDRSPGEVYGDAGAYRVERRMLLEAFAVMRARGLVPVPLPGMDVRLLRLGLRLPDWMGRPILRRVIAGARGSKSPSLRRHAALGSGPSEVDWLNGAVDREAKRLGRAAPCNRRLAELVGEILADPGRKAWFRGRPDRLVEDVARPH
ncbi:MAG: ketopantoate reductase C-terminal domain-containing protein [Candidatus Limnocylindrales bacterium]